MSPLPNIGLIGKLRSGKSAAGDYLASKYGYTQFAFGDELKDDFHREYPDIPREPKPRAGYQEYGQRMRRERGENVWIDACLGKIADIHDNYALGKLVRYYGELAEPFRAVITDCRQLNEAEALASRSFVLIRVEAPDSLRIQRAKAAGDTFTDADLAHDTETALDGCTADFTVVNDAGLAELYAQIDEIMGYLRLTPETRYLALKDGAAA
ncbi:AAA family ATPase [Paenibacillus sp. 7124]|uniref:AAA family ATPase n=1 Tax=Paenibacillus apii TaxID=1850370 RepID=A0A6M1PD85_9BACL|nr:AAA family ATPase [Paenibacillus apii]NGM81219.1 AAA family ATPase [Paenibacillus apii]